MFHIIKNKIQTHEKLQNLFWPTISTKINQRLNKEEDEFIIAQIDSHRDDPRLKKDTQRSTWWMDDSKKNYKMKKWVIKSNEKKEDAVSKKTRSQVSQALSVVVEEEKKEQ